MGFVRRFAFNDFGSLSVPLQAGIDHEPYKVMLLFALPRVFKTLFFRRRTVISSGEKLEHCQCWL
jgi:hypothetical protein